MFRELDIASWDRRTAYEFFLEFADPYVNVAANIDVTELHRFCKANDLAFSLAGLFYSLQTANEIREFRLRLSDQGVIEFDRIHATQTILNEDATFSFCYFELCDDVTDFDRKGRAAVEKYKAMKTFDVESDRIDLVYYSVIPWVSFTSFKHATRGDRRMSIPRMVFGRMFDENGRKKMPFSVEVHHALMDGIHIGRYFELFQTKLNSL
jgi:chloramphenicol O-acetyltransferase type A